MSQLTHLENTLSLPGCTLHANGLEITRALTDDEVEHIGRALNTIEQSGLWWWGDYLCHLENKGGDKYADAIAKSSYAYQSLANAKWVCGKFAFSNRLESVSFKHFQEALSECDGNASKALEWLAKARAEKWSVSEMRKAIRESKATGSGKDDPPPQSSAYDHLKGLKLWARKDLASADLDMIDAIDAELSEFRVKLLARRQEIISGK